MMLFLWCLFGVSAAIRLIWWGFFRVHLPSKGSALRNVENKYPDEGISIIVCAHNNIAGLQLLIPKLLSQQHLCFEIVIVDDRSSDGTKEWLNQQSTDYEKLKVIHIDKTPEDWTGKKYALSQGIKASQYPYIALTDSDCIPLSNNWLSHIIEQLKESKKSIFLGYSPYEEKKGILNGIIQTETFFTALQYFSMAHAGHTYMGVGRNLGYQKSFLENHMNNFPHKEHLGGDDDLLINSVSTGSDAVTCVHPDSFVLTFPPQNLTTWWKQKRRHLSAGNKYKWSTRQVLASYWISASFFWLSSICIIIAGTCTDINSVFIVLFSFFVAGTIIYGLFSDYLEQ